MASTNTEKPTGKNEAKKQVPASIVKNKKKDVAPIKGTKKEEKQTLEKTETKEEKKKEVKKVKRFTASVNVSGIHASTKVSVAICKFIKNKPIKKAIEDLEEVARLKKAVPMKGEIPHRKGKIMSGRFPKNASESFVYVLKGLMGNANQNDLEEPIITEAVANKGSRPYGKGGRWKRKRTNVKLTCTEKKVIENKKEKKK